MKYRITNIETYQKILGDRQRSYEKEHATQLGFSHIQDENGNRVILSNQLSEKYGDGYLFEENQLDNMMKEFKQ